MANDPTQLVTRIPRAEKAEFMSAAKANDDSASRLVRGFVRQYIKDHPMPKAIGHK